MKNKISDLRNHLFDTIERLKDPEENDSMTIEKALAIAEIGKVIVDSAKTEVMAMKALGLNPDEVKNEFLQIGE